MRLRRIKNPKPKCQLCAVSNYPAQAENQNPKIEGGFHTWLTEEYHMQGAKVHSTTTTEITFTEMLTQAERTIIFTTPKKV